MLTVRGSAAGLFLMRRGAGELLAGDSIYALLAEHGDRIVRERGLRGVLLGVSWPSVDPAESVGEGAIAGVSGWAV